jgi:hypothetical protein
MMQVKEVSLPRAQRGCECESQEERDRVGRVGHCDTRWSARFIITSGQEGRHIGSNEKA